MSDHQNKRQGMSSSQTSDRPVIGVAPDISEPKPGRLRIECGLTYLRAIEAVGGYPIVLAPDPRLIASHLEACDAIVLTGGDDPRTEPFGEPTHPKATPMHPLRQEFDTALLAELGRATDIPTLGICLGMQMMALCSGGSLDQHLPESTPTADRHYHDQVHEVVPCGEAPHGLVLAGAVTSYHRQAVRHPGSMTVAARSDDGIIEAIVRPGAAFALGVQWHPERTQDHRVGQSIFQALLEAASIYRRSKSR